MPDASIIRTADWPDYSPLYDYLFLYAGVSVALWRRFCALVCISVHTDVVAERVKEASFSCFLFALCLFVYAACLREHTSVWQSVSVCEDERPSKTNKTKQKETDREKKTLSYSCLPVCLHLVVSFPSVCSPHSRRSTLVTVFGDGEDRKGEIMC